MTGKRLVVDAQADVVEFLEKCLRRKGHEVISARDGTAGLKIAAEEVPDLILLNVRTPRFDEIETCRTLKGKDATKKIPVVALTAAQVEGSPSDGLAQCIDRFIHKPFNVADFWHQIEEALGAVRE